MYYSPRISFGSIRLGAFKRNRMFPGSANLLIGALSCADQEIGAPGREPIRGNCALRQEDRNSPGDCTWVLSIFCALIVAVNYV